MLWCAFCCYANFLPPNLGFNQRLARLTCKAAQADTDPSFSIQHLIFSTSQKLWQLRENQFMANAPWWKGTRKIRVVLLNWRGWEGRARGHIFNSASSIIFSPRGPWQQSAQSRSLYILQKRLIWICRHAAVMQAVSCFDKTQKIKIILVGYPNCVDHKKC